MNHEKFRFNSVSSLTFKIIKGFFFNTTVKIYDLIMMYIFGVLTVDFQGPKAIRIVLNYESFH